MNGQLHTPASLLLAEETQLKQFNRIRKPVLEVLNKVNILCHAGNRTQDHRLAHSFVTYLNSFHLRLGLYLPLGFPVKILFSFFCPLRATVALI
jgi:hypothetical protein